jgi:large subunit ribosomal protein L23
MLTATDVVKRPLITEKCTWEGQERNRYSFEVDLHASKEQIKAAIVELYKVRVLKVATQVRKGEFKKTRFGETRRPSWKKATVQVHPEDKIDLL